jgi:hypothetical protein
MTVDYMEYVCTNSTTLPALNNPKATVPLIRMENDRANNTHTQKRSDGRSQPYIGNGARPLKDLQLNNATGGVQHTFGAANKIGSINTPPGADPFKLWPVTPTGAPANPRRWLLHLDRPLVSPMELMHVTALKPHELTQQFVTMANNQVQFYQHRVPWFDEDKDNFVGAPISQSHRLYRFFEFVATRRFVAKKRPDPDPNFEWEVPKVYNKFDIQPGTDQVVTPEWISRQVDPNPDFPYQLPAMSGVTIVDTTIVNNKLVPIRNPHGVPWSIQPGAVVTGSNPWDPAPFASMGLQPGSVLIIEPGTQRQENVVVKLLRSAAPGQPPFQFVADFYLFHPKGSVIQITTLGDRIPGKVNLNTIQDPEPFQAVCNPAQYTDPLTKKTTYSNNYTEDDIYKPSGGMSMFAPIFNQLLKDRQPGDKDTVPMIPPQRSSAKDAPFLGMAPGFYDTNNFLLNNTIFRHYTQGASDPKHLFHVPVASFTGDYKPGNFHPYEGQQLYTRTGNTFTSRSNVFAVWLTVGFFEVIQDSVEITDASGQKQIVPLRPVKLGAEIGRAENRHVRHRMFAIVDRSHLTVPSDMCQLAGSVSPGPQTVEVGSLSAAQPSPFYAIINPTPMPTPTSPWVAPPKDPPMTWTLQPGDRVVVGYGQSNQETVVIENLVRQNNKFFIQARFTQPHFPNELISVAVIPGNPGPITGRFNPRDPLYEEVVPYLSMIE